MVWKLSQIRDVTSLSHPATRRGACRICISSIQIVILPKPPMNKHACFEIDHASYSCSEQARRRLEQSVIPSASAAYTLVEGPACERLSVVSEYYSAVIVIHELSLICTPNAPCTSIWGRSLSSRAWGSAMSFSPLSAMIWDLGWVRCCTCSYSSVSEARPLLVACCRAVLVLRRRNLMSGLRVRH